ncbi:MAG: O-antigen ligase family protein [Actinomycetes bacterium]
MGSGLAVALVCWAWLISPTVEGPVQYAGAAVACAVAYAAASALARVSPPAPGLLVAGAVLATFVLHPVGLTSGAALAAPLGYANANAALITCAVAALLLCAEINEPPTRWLFYAAAVVIALLSIGTGSKAGAITALGMVLLWPVVRGLDRRAIAVGCAALLALGLALVTGAGLARDSDDPQSGGLDSAAAAVVTERRVQLWSEALDLTAERPVTGVGAGRFDEESPSARADRDARWAHSEPLQVAAETGLVGLCLLVALLIWVLVALAAGPSRAGVVGILLVLALGAQASIDYVLHFPAVLVAAAAVVGASGSVTASLDGRDWGSPGSRRLRRRSPSV